MTTYEIDGKKIIRVFNAGPHEEREIAALCDEPFKALGLLMRAWSLNGKSKYTASARAIAKAEALPGFEWSTK